MPSFSGCASRIIYIFLMKNKRFLWKFYYSIICVFKNSFFFQFYKTTLLELRHCKHPLFTTALYRRPVPHQKAHEHAPNHRIEGVHAFYSIHSESAHSGRLFLADVSQALELRLTGLGMLLVFGHGCRQINKCCLKFSWISYLFRFNWSLNFNLEKCRNFRTNSKFSYLTFHFLYWFSLLAKSQRHFH